ncbi:undecaprenyldiphospho-muramoylpentapeptide beta-N-acetylglucosaminyltransferase [Candidatus Finniella inopinata]|uniref:UDP-N-acetylglucosamine--N-acetylmuramyl-(pentapeptide) pyrophosphoryl-undecaprenol N-acetylglucosamine transferase n=1 Tax=Candidatus Finniella inopinata TaxID=1696036 RepID=A0A4Q7DGY6_9PROT|nr:undecaprenyldiphospho-muramoylpentapeptide beta-N-acetylglucosaminyltransferase [Candidatus Finniella inopinata]RZI45952.1 undecaprenyldiphospho-muramoylpentapeptide beta-N-acetylglucosaminyltransferase [Candidatus Finniella inopinata]
MKRFSYKPLYVLVSGGTGGHLFPALSLCRKLKNHGRQVYLITDERSQNFNHAKDFDKIYPRTIHRTAPVIGRLMLYLSILFHFFYCYFLYRKINPTIVVGFGGYPSVAPLLAAQLRGIPTVIHEQNALLGKANRLVAKRAYRVATSFENVEWAPVNTTLTGNPIRPEILALKDEPYHAPASTDRFNILVIGGSQGAKIFSEIVPDALVSLPLELQKRLKVVQQCRPEFLPQTKVIYRQSFLDVELTTFIEDIATQYRQAHLVICRAGASTIAELAVVRRPAILVPYAASLESDQSYNAAPMVKANAAWVIKESEFTPEVLSSLLEKLMLNPDILTAASQAMQAFSKPDASEKLANTVADVIGDLLT